MADLTIPMHFRLRSTAYRAAIAVVYVAAALAWLRLGWLAVQVLRLVRPALHWGLVHVDESGHPVRRRK